MDVDAEKTFLPSPYLGKKPSSLAIIKEKKSSQQVLMTATISVLLPNDHQQDELCCFCPESHSYRHAEMRQCVLLSELFTLTCD